MLAQMALDILPCQALSVPCERLFSSSKQVITERRACLGSDQLEQLLIMKSAWQGSIVDWAAVNSSAVDEIAINEYSDLLQADTESKVWDEEDLQFLLEPGSDSDIADYARLLA